MAALRSMVKAVPKPAEETATLLAAEVARLAPINLYVLELDTQDLTWSNSHIFTSLGYSAAHIASCGHAFAMGILHPDDRPQAEARFANWSTTDRHRHRDFVQRLRHQGGQWRWFACTEKVFRVDASGRPTHIVGASLDVTERIEEDARKRRELAALRAQVNKSFQNYERLAESIPQLVWVLDAQGHALYFNQPWIDYTGIGLTGKASWSTVIHHDDVEASRDLWHRGPHCGRTSR